MYAPGCLSKTLNEILNMMIFATNSFMPLGKNIDQLGLEVAFWGQRRG